MRKRDFIKLVTLLAAADYLHKDIKVANAINNTQNPVPNPSTCSASNISASFNHSVTTQYNYRVRLRNGTIQDLTTYLASRGNQNSLRLAEKHRQFLSETERFAKLRVVVLGGSGAAVS